MSLQSETIRPAASVDPNEIPIINIGPVLARTPGAVEQIAEEVYNACTGMGFLFLVNHGLDMQTVEDTFEASRRFHALPMEEKLKVRMNRHQCGYMPPNVSVHSDTFEKHQTALKPWPLWVSRRGL